MLPNSWRWLELPHCNLLLRWTFSAFNIYFSNVMTLLGLQMIKLSAFLDRTNIIFVTLEFASDKDCVGY